MLNVEIISWADRRRAAGIATPQIRPIRILSPEPPRRHRLAPVLATADEADLVRRYLRGDRMSGDRLLRAHDNMIRSKACRLARRCSLLEESDLVQAGRIGFLDALRTFDPE
jgi:DNA-directed RNA polymerase sigma subunit (sigma70/sigma32)